MNIQQRRISYFMALASLCATASFAQQVKTDFDRSIDFSQYKTYSFVKVQTQNPLLVDRIKAAVNSALTAKGWTQVESVGNVAITAMEMTKDHRTLNTYYDNFGGGWGWRFGGGFGGGFGDATTTEDTYRVGTLVVDLFDANIGHRGLQYLMFAVAGFAFSLKQPGYSGAEALSTRCSSAIWVR